MHLIEFFKDMPTKLAAKDLATQVFIRTFLKELSLSLASVNEAPIKQFTTALLSIRDMKDAKPKLDAFLKEYMGYASFEEVTKLGSPETQKIIKKKVELDLGYMTYLQLQNLNIILKFAEKAGSQNDPAIMDRSLAKKSIERIQAMGWKEMLDGEQEKILPEPPTVDTDIINKFFELQNTFGIVDICVPVSMGKVHLRRILFEFQRDLTALAEFLKIRPDVLCPFRIVLAGNSRLGASAFGIYDRTMYLSEVSTHTFIKEWFHYFDFKLGSYLKRVMKSYDMDVENPYWTNMKYMEVLDKMKHSEVFAMGEFLKQLIPPSASSDADKVKLTPPEHELFSRAFEIWIHSSIMDKLKACISPALGKNPIYPTGPTLQMSNMFWDKNWPSIKYVFEMGFDVVVHKGQVGQA